MTDAASVMAALAAIALLAMLIGWWRAENRADAAEAARDAAVMQCATATALANKHWYELRAARAELEQLQQTEEQHWATVPRETPDSNAGGHAPQPGEFCAEHFSWLCQAGQGQCQREQPTTLLPMVVVGDDRPTAVLPAVLDRRAR